MLISNPGDPDWSAALARARAEDDARVEEAKQRARDAFVRAWQDAEAEFTRRTTTADWLVLQGRRKANEGGR